MGLFLSASGVAASSSDLVRNAIESYVAATGGTFEFREGTTEDRNIGVIQSTPSTTTVFYPDGFTDWDDLSRYLSQQLSTSVFSFHMHDGDLWMFVGFKDGEECAWFNPIPDYWAEIDDNERNRWLGDADSVAALVPGVTPSSIERYFVPWTDDAVAGEHKAYADDECPIGVDWQLLDFMRRLGFVYPFDDCGKPTGETFYLKISRTREKPNRPMDTEAQPTASTPRQRIDSKPWWKFW